MSFTASVDHIVEENASGLLAKHSSWCRVRLHEVATVLNGFPFPSESFSRDSGTPLLRIRDILNNHAEANFLGSFDHAYIVETGELVVGMDGDFNAALWKGPCALLNQRVCKITPDPQFYSKKFLSYVLPGYLKAINECTPSVTVKHLSSRTIAEIPLPLPPLDEQNRIVAEVDEQFTRLDAAISSLRHARQALKSHRAAILKAACEGRLVPTEAELSRKEGQEYVSGDYLLEQILSGKEKSRPRPPYSELPQGWTMAFVEEIAEVGTGATPLRSNPKFYEAGNIPWVTSGALNSPYVKEPSEFVTEEALRETNLTIYPKGTLLVAMYGEGKTRGKCSELLIEACTNQAIAAIVTEGLAAECRPFIKLYFQKNYEDLRRLSAGGVQPNLNLSLIKRMALSLPPLAELKRITAEADRILSLTGNLAVSIEANLIRANHLRQSVLRSAFEGNLASQDPTDEPAAVLLERIRQRREAAADFRPRRGRGIKPGVSTPGTATPTDPKPRRGAGNRSDLPREGQRHVAWGVSPREERPHQPQSPVGATADQRSGNGRRRPSGASDRSMTPFPGADAPGYMPLPLTGQGGPEAAGNAGPDFLSLSREEQIDAVWNALLGCGALEKEEAVRTAAQSLRDQGLASFQRLRQGGPLWEAIAGAVDRGVREGSFDRPRRGYVRALLSDARSYTPEIWRRCLLDSLDHDAVEEDQALRAAAEWARESLGLEFERLREDGVILRGLRAALQVTVRTGEIKKTRGRITRSGDQS